MEDTRYLIVETHDLEKSYVYSENGKPRVFLTWPEVQTVMPTLRRPLVLTIREKRKPR